MSGNRQVPLSPEMNQLRRMVGLSGGTTAPIKTVHQAPRSEELLTLLQKQDTVISELFAELETCKTEMKSLRSGSVQSMAENKQLFDQLKVELNEKLTELNNSKPNSRCENCELLRRQIRQRDLESATPQSAATTAPITIMKSQELECIPKLQTAVALAERKTVENHELRTRLKTAEEQIAEEKNNAQLAEKAHTIEFEEFKRRTKEGFQAELNNAYAKITALEISERYLTEQIDGFKQKINDLREEKEEERQQFACKEKRLSEDISRLQKELGDLRSDLYQKQCTHNEQIGKLKFESDIGAQKYEFAQKRNTDLEQLLESSTRELTQLRNSEISSRDRCDKAERALILAEHNNSRLSHELSEVKRTLQSERIKSVRDCTDKEETVRNELECMLVAEKSLVGSLKAECTALTDEMARREKEHRKETKRLNRELCNLRNRYEKIVANSESQS